jgi:hypothetical protein
MPEQTSTAAAELRAAAQKLRDLAERAAHEDRTDWIVGHTKGSRSPVVLDHVEEPSVLIETYAARLEAVNRYVAAMGPRVGVLLAAWLESEAARHEACATAAKEIWVIADHPDAAAWMATGPGAVKPEALAVARAIGGEPR